MSKEAAAEFLRRVSEDKLLREELVELAHQRGFQFTADELGSMDLTSPDGVLRHTDNRSG